MTDDPWRLSWLEPSLGCISLHRIPPLRKGLFTFQSRQLIENMKNYFPFDMNYEMHTDLLILT